MTIRAATIDDLPLVMEMAVKFISDTPYAKYANGDKIRALITDVLSSDGRTKVCILKGTSGMIAGIASPFIYGDTLIATELAWWVEPEARAKHAGKELLDAFEYWAKLAGCSAITMVSLDDQLGTYYERKGYHLFERAYMKEI